MKSLIGKTFSIKVSSLHTGYTIKVNGVKRGMCLCEIIDSESKLLIGQTRKEDPDFLTTSPSSTETK